MANKRIRKKRDPYIKSQKVLKEAERNVDRQIRKQRQVELAARKVQRVGRASGLFKVSGLARSINYFGEVVQHKTGIFSSEYQRLRNEKMNIHNEIVALQRENMAQREAERFNRIKTREKDYAKNLETVQRLEAKQSLGKQLTSAERKRLLKANYDIQKYETITRNLMEHPHAYRIGRQYFGDDIDNATKWAAVRKYNELLKEGVVPPLSGMENYEDAIRALDFLPYDEMMEILEEAEGKRKVLQAKYQDMVERIRNDLNSPADAAIRSRMRRPVR